MPSSNTPFKELEQLMHGSTVRMLIIESLKPLEAATANPALALMDKKKNHWVFRLVLDKPFTYFVGGKKRVCLSVRASVEPSIDGKRACDNLTLKPMPIDVEKSTSTLRHFLFEIPKQDKGKRLRVYDYVRAADPLLPFSYKIVSKTIVPPEPKDKGKGKGRSEKERGEIRKHLNGCRDFVTQWFIQCYLRKLVPWQNIDYSQFHEIIGNRYGNRNEHVSPIAQAVFHRFNRLTECPVQYHNGQEVVQESVSLPYQTETLASIPVYEAYDYEQMRQPGRAGSSSYGDLDSMNIQFSDWRLQ